MPVKGCARRKARGGEYEGSVRSLRTQERAKRNEAGRDPRPHGDGQSSAATPSLACWLWRTPLEVPPGTRRPAGVRAVTMTHPTSQARGRPPWQRRTGRSLAPPFWRLLCSTDIRGRSPYWTGTAGRAPRVTDPPACERPRASPPDPARTALPFRGRHGAPGRLPPPAVRRFGTVRAGLQGAEYIPLHPQRSAAPGAGTPGAAVGSRSW